MIGAVRAGVVGHVEWLRFAVVDHLPRPGEIVAASEHFEAAAGGGAVAAVQMRLLAGAATFATALGDDEAGVRAGAELEHEHGVELLAARRPAAQRLGFCHLDDTSGERTITVMGERLVPHGADAIDWARVGALDAVYLTGADAGGVRLARAAGVLVATPRALHGVDVRDLQLDVLVASAGDRGELLDLGRFAQPPRHVVRTRGSRGGDWEAADGRRGSWAPVAPPGPPVDVFGCGDVFAAGLTVGLGAGLTIEASIALGARCGAWCSTGRGPYGRLLTAAEL